MLEFKEVTYLYRLAMHAGGTEEIRTNEGYVYIDYRGYYRHTLIALDGVSVIPWYFLKEDSILYIMKEEPVFYVWI